jgi:gas vesicle protein
MVGLASNAFKIFSMVQNFMGGGGGGLRPTSSSTNSDPDRVDKIASTTTTSDGNDIDLAMGTLMAYGGKYLRELARWAWEMTSNTKVDSLGTNSVDTVDSNSIEVSNQVDQISEKIDQDVSETVESVTAVMLDTAADSGVSPLKLLSPEELESLGLKAVSAGAEPIKLQQAFATAQINGDWTDLENLIKEALGPNSIPKTPTVISVGGGSKPGRPSSQKVPSSSSSSNPSTSSVSVSTVQVPVGSTGGTDIMSGISSIVTNLISGGTSSVNKIGEAAGTETSESVVAPSGGLGYYANQAQSYIKRMEKVIAGPDAKDPPSDDPMDASVLTRFIKEFKLQKEALAVQFYVNDALTKVNELIGSDDNDNKDPYSNTGGSTSSVSTSSSSASGGILATFSQIPQALASTAMNFFSSNQPAAQNKVGVAAGEDDPNPTVTYSNVNTVNTGNLATIGLLGTAAVGTVLYSLFASSNGRNSKDDDSINRRNGIANSNQQLYQTRFGQESQHNRYQTQFTKRSVPDYNQELNMVEEPDFKVREVSSWLEDLTKILKTGKFHGKLLPFHLCIAEGHNTKLNL